MSKSNYQTKISQIQLIREDYCCVNFWFMTDFPITLFSFRLYGELEWFTEVVDNRNSKKNNINISDNSPSAVAHYETARVYLNVLVQLWHQCRVSCRSMNKKHSHRRKEVKIRNSKKFSTLIHLSQNVLTSRHFHASYVNTPHSSWVFNRLQ